MKDFQNNAYFWQKIDSLCLSGDLINLVKKGEADKEFPNYVMPCDYGYLKFLDGDSQSLHYFKGSLNNEVNGIILCADILSKRVDAKILLGCSEVEEEAILRYLNQDDFRKTVLIKRGSEVPSWASTTD